MQNNQIKVKKKNEKLVDGITNMSLAWKVETCKRYKLSITGGGGCENKWAKYERFKISYKALF